VTSPESGGRKERVGAEGLRERKKRKDVKRSIEERERSVCRLRGEELLIMRSQKGSEEKGDCYVWGRAGRGIMLRLEKITACGGAKKKRGGERGGS